MKILEFSWKDLKHPQAGGAEVVTDHYLRMLAADGHEVTLFSAKYRDAKAKETFNGYTIVRRGNKVTVYLEAIKYYLTEAKGKFDIVIDQINTIPFFTPLYVKEKKIAFVHQLAKEYWFYETPPIIAHIGYFLEPIMLSFYKSTPTIAISPSTKKDLTDIGFKDVTIIYDGLDVKPLKKPKKKQNLIVYVGRVTRAKRVDHAIEAFAHLEKTMPKYRLAIIGTGPEDYLKELMSLVERRGIKEKVDFLGRVSTATRNNLMARAKVLVNPSIREGWGLVVLEANAMGTPAVVYDVPGLRDSVKEGLNGAVCRKLDALGLGKKLKMILEMQKNKDFFNCIRYTERFNWKTSYLDFWKVIGLEDIE